MTYTHCLASLEPLKPGEEQLGYRKAAKMALFGTTDVQLPLSFSRADFFTKGREYTKGMSISGVQQKLSLRIDPKTRELVTTREGGEFILKPSPEDFPNAAENEHAAMVASGKIGINTAKSGLIAFNDGELAYITRRFDRNKNGEKVHQEDLVQIAGREIDDKYRISYEQAGVLVDQATSGKLAVMLDLFKRVLFSYVIANNDLHMKNLSLQRLADNVSGIFDRLTPTYDVLLINALDSFKEGHFLACELLTDAETGEEEFSEQYQKYGYYTGYDFLELGKRYGLLESTVKKAIKHQIQKASDIKGVIEASYMPGDMKIAATQLVEERTRGISTGITR